MSTGFPRLSGLREAMRDLALRLVQEVREAVNGPSEQAPRRRIYDYAEASRRGEGGVIPVL